MGRIDASGHNGTINKTPGSISRSPSLNQLLQDVSHSVLS